MGIGLTARGESLHCRIKTIDLSYYTSVDTARQVTFNDERLGRRDAAHRCSLGSLGEQLTVRPIHQFSHDEAQRIYAWARYVFWAEVEGQQYEQHECAEDESPVGVGTVLMLQFYASDLPNDCLLLDFLRESEHAATWAYLLHHEFKRVVWEVAHPSGVSAKLQGELADAIRGIVGWLPDDLPEAAPYKAGERYRDAAAMILKAGRRSTTHAKELLDAVSQVRVAADEASWSWTQQKRAMIEALKKQRQLSANDTT